MNALTKHLCKTTFLAALVGGGTAVSAAPQLTADAAMGMRQAGFLAAPTEQRQNLSEFAVATRVLLPVELPVSLSGGAFASFQAMANSLGDGLTDFSGYQIGPELRMAKQWAALTPFARLRYAFGRFEGKGTENWGNQPEAAFFLYDTADSTTKSFVSRGTHIAVGAGWSATKALSLNGEIDLGYEMIRSDARVIDNDREFSGKDVTAYRSQALLVGAGYTL